MTSTKKRSLEEVTKKRSRVIGVITVLALVLCSIQLFIIQIVRGPALAEQGRQVRTSASVIAAPRGQIVDADGQVLVDSAQSYHLAVNQEKILEYEHLDDDGEELGRGPAEAAKLLAPILGLDEAELGGELLGDSTYHYIKKDVDLSTYRKVRGLGIYGIEWEPVYTRTYPSGPTAASVIGSVGADGEGNSGLELVYNSILEGTPGEESYEIGPTGAVIPGAKAVTKDAKQGGIVHTTIRSDLQSAVQKDLDNSVSQHQADWGAAVALDVETGNVLVLADSGLKPPSVGPQESRAIQSVFEPGSVGKVLTMATAIEKGGVGPTTPFQVPDTYQTSDGEVFTDLHEHEPYDRTVSGILTESSNTGTIKVGETVSADERYQTMLDLGLGQETGIELPGESSGLLSTPDEWWGRTSTVTMFGQGYALTTLQEAAMMAAIGNGGVWQAPRLVSGVTDGKGLYQEAERPAPRQALRPETAQVLLRMMESVVADEEHGTGSAAELDGYRVALKTGTAELPDGGIASTVAGVVPVDNPQVAIALVLYNPRVGYLSSDSAAPLFQKIAASAMRDLGIPASTSEPELYPYAP